jgi:hypothetical protein
VIWRRRTKSTPAFISEEDRLPLGTGSQAEPPPMDAAIQQLLDQRMEPTAETKKQEKDIQDEEHKVVKDARDTHEPPPVKGLAEKEEDLGDDDDDDDDDVSEFYVGEVVGSLAGGGRRSVVVM